MEAISNKVDLGKVAHYKTKHEMSAKNKVNDKDKFNMKVRGANQNLEAVILQEQEDEKQDNYSMSEDIKALKKMLEEQLESSENTKDDFMELAKIMEIVRRIANGDKVPAKDEKKLLEYNSKLYMAAKSAASLRHNKNPKKYKSLYEDEEEKQNQMDEENQEGVSEIEEAPGKEIEPSEQENETEIQPTN